MLPFEKMLEYKFVGFGIGQAVFPLDFIDDKWNFSGPKKVNKIIIDAQGIFYDVMMKVVSVRDVFEFEKQAEEECLRRNEES